jgi:transcriptional regulator with PAS, ATPase and Fis domain
MAFPRDGVGYRSPNHNDIPRMLGESRPMVELRSLIESAGCRACTVLIQGESGTGKELIAQYIHAASPRRSQPFVPVDCTTLQDTLLESQLFGHVKGAFTGAETSTLGFFRAADSGTLFLDEIGELTPAVQAKLLRCIQDRAVVPLGSVKPIPIDVRIVAATHRDLRAMVRNGDFRQDLFFRLNVVRLTAPALRVRQTDISLLARHFLAQYAELYDEPAKVLSDEAVRYLEAYEWPGNVRELANIIEQAHVLTKGSIVTPSDLPDEIRQAVALERMSDSQDDVMPLASAERMLIAQALRATQGNQAEAARMLRIDRRRLYRKVRQYRLRSLIDQLHQ